MHYHRTTRAIAKSVLSGGFRDATGTYLTDREHGGVWVSDVQLDENEGAGGDALLVIEGLEPREIAPYEWIEAGKPYREWCVPAAILNAARIREAS